MRYLFYKIRKNILFNFRIYIFLIIELIVGFSILIVAINHTMSVNERLNVFYNQYKENTIYINIYQKMNGFSTEPQLSYDDYIYIKEKYEGQLTPTLMVRRPFAVFDPLTNYEDVYDINLLFLSDDFFNEKLPENTAFIGKNIRKAIDVNGLIPPSYGIEFMDDKIIIDGIHEMSILDVSKNSLTLNEFTINILVETFKIDDCIIVPSSIYSYNETIQIALCLEFEGEQNVQKISQEITDYLYETHNQEYTYGYSQVIVDFKRINEGLLHNIRFLEKVGWAMIVILTVGFTGVVLILTNKRRRAMAISMAMGAKFTSIAAELFMEIFSICLISGIISNIIGWVLTNRIEDYAVFELTPHVINIPIILLMSVGITLLSTIMSIFDIRKLKPIEILRSL